MDGPRVTGLIEQLRDSKIAQAREYLRARQGPPLAGRAPNEMDALMGARLALDHAGLADPEVLRYQLAAALGFSLAVSRE